MLTLAVLNRKRENVDVITGHLCGSRRHRELACGCNASKQLVRRRGVAVSWVSGLGERDLLPFPNFTQTLWLSSPFAPNSCKGVTFHQKSTLTF